MTCIVALRHEGVVYMGCDSAGVGGYSRSNRVDPKIYLVDGKMLIGFTSSFRMGQLLGYSLKLPQHHSDVPLMEYMVTSFINAARDCLKAGGYAEKDKEVESGGTFIVGYQGKVLEVQSNYQVAERVEPFTAVGCGEDLALGSLYTSQLAGITDPRRRLELALSAAAAFSAGVHPPFRFEELKP